MIGMMIGGMLLLGFLFLLPLLLVGLALRLAFKILLLPFKILGALVGLGIGMAGLAAGVLVLAGGLVLVPVLLIGAVLLLPLALLLLGALMTWGLVRLLRPKPAA